MHPSITCRIYPKLIRDAFDDHYSSICYSLVTKIHEINWKNCDLLLKVCSGCWFSKVREISSHDSEKLRPPRDLKLSQRLLIMFRNVAKFWFLEIRSRFFTRAFFLLKAHDFAGCDRWLGPQSDKNWELGKNKIMQHFRPFREQPLLISAPHSF